MLRNHQIVISYLLLGALGVFGAHRFYAERTATAWLLLLISGIQLMVSASMFMKPINPLYFWPPYDALINIHALMALLASKPLPEGASPQLMEEAYVRPELWLATLPSPIVCLWVLVDALTPSRWMRIPDKDDALA